MKRDRCYEILELPATASRKEILQGYRDLVNVWHPDRFGHNPRLRQRAEEKLKQLNQAYEILTRETLPSAVDERRAFPRIHCRLPLEHASGVVALNSLKDHIRDISGSGAFIVTAEPYAQGQQVRLSFTLPRFGNILNMAGRIVRCAPEGVGVVFVISPRFQHLLAQVV